MGPFAPKTQPLPRRMTEKKRREEKAFLKFPVILLPLPALPGNAAVRFLSVMYCSSKSCLRRRCTSLTVSSFSIPDNCRYVSPLSATFYIFSVFLPVLPRRRLFPTLPAPQFDRKTAPAPPPHSARPYKAEGWACGTATAAFRPCKRRLPAVY